MDAERNVVRDLRETVFREHAPAVDEHRPWLPPCEVGGVEARPEFVPRCAQHDHACLLHLRHITGGGDPFEMLEARPLDFGHWSAHKLEPLTAYQVRHGEAVAIGVAIDCIYSSMKFGFPEADAINVCRCLSQLGLQLWHPELQPVDRLMEGLEEFRQHLGGRLTLTMLEGIGQPIDVHEVDRKKMLLAIEAVAQYALSCS